LRQPVAGYAAGFDREIREIRDNELRNPTEAARIRIEKMLEQSVTKVPILAVQTREVYNISIPGL